MTKSLLKRLLFIIHFGLNSFAIVENTADMIMTVVMNVGATVLVSPASHSDKIPIGVVKAPSKGIGHRNSMTPMREGIRNFAILLPVSLKLVISLFRNSLFSQKYITPYYILIDLNLDLSLNYG